MGAQNFNVAPKFLQNGDFQPKFCIFRRKFSDRLEFRESNGNFPSLPYATDRNGCRVRVGECRVLFAENSEEAVSASFCDVVEV